MSIEDIKNKVLAGHRLSEEEAYFLAELPVKDQNALWEAAEEVTRKFCGKDFDSCSIINARSGSCPENCKWCAQSARHNTDIVHYPLVGHDECMEAARVNMAHGIHRFSLVASGRKMSGKTLDKVCEYFREMSREGGLKLCASLGLLEKDELLKLKEAGVTRYHCNLETAPSHFPTLCTTHTIEDKLNTIKAAREIGMDVCSGGIIGMGETMRQRVEFALKLREIEPKSIPVNILIPIPGTPLEGTPPLGEEEILTTISIFRLLHPGVQIRFAGGRNNLSREAQLKALKICINGAIMGDMLTTIGSQVAQDKELIREAGMNF